ncbi:MULTISPECIES: YfbK domain-containing protein [Chitinophagaceae]
METRDILLEAFKTAAEKEQPIAFDGMEDIWLQIEAKLEEDEKKKIIPIWRKWLAAATILIILGIGVFLLAHKKSNTNYISELPKRPATPLVVENKKDTITGHSIDNRLPTTIENKNLSVIEKLRDEKMKRLTKIFKSPLTTKTKLQDVMVTSAQIVRKRSVTGSITIMSRSSYEMQRGTEYARSIDSSLFFKIKELNITESNKPPLIILNGQIVDATTLYNITTDNIQSINILKDSSATALYGIRGSMGAIIITSKKPISVALNTESYESYNENEFVNPISKPFSTFSIDVDNASYTNIRRFINNGQQVPKDAVRVEEMINFFKYHTPQPKNNDPFTINSEYGIAPWNLQHNILKVSLQGKTIPEELIPASNLVFLIDVSGSMNEPNKLPLLQTSMKLLVGKLRAQDKVSIVTYAGNAGLVLPATSGAEKQTIIKAIDNLSAGGSTAGGEGIELAYKIGKQQFIDGGNNRVVLATDGDFNVGISSEEDLETFISEKRKSNIFLTCLGFGMGNYKDSKMQTLAQKGNGNYAYIDNLQEANRILVKEFGGTMFTIAKDVKIQIEFNPSKVKAYRLIGYETRLLRDEDFANDSIDAGEMGSGHTVTALYEIIPRKIEKDSLFKEITPPNYRQPGKNIFKNRLATIKTRYKDPTSNESIELKARIKSMIENGKQVSTDFRLATTVAWFGLKLRDSKLVPNKSTHSILEWGKSARYDDPDGYIAEFFRLIETQQP